MLIIIRLWMFIQIAIFMNTTKEMKPTGNLFYFLNIITCCYGYSVHFYRQIFHKYIHIRSLGIIYKFGNFILLFIS